MTVDQVKYLKEQLNKDNGSGHAVANSVFYDMDNGMAFRNNNDFVIFDDSKELIHCIAVNRHANVKDESPFCLITAGYEQVQFVEANLDMDGLKKVLTDVFGSLLTTEQSNTVIDWAQKIPSTPLSPAVGNYYKGETGPQLPQRKVSIITRYNDMEVAEKPLPVEIVKAEDLAEALVNLSEGATIAISTSEPYEETMTISSKGVTINASKAVLDGGLVVEDTASDLTIEGANLSDNNNEGGTTRLMTLKADNFTMKNSTITTNKYFRMVAENFAQTLTFENVVFDGNGETYNGIEYSYGNAKTKNLVFRDCTFKKGYATNNCVSVYDLAEGATILFENCILDCGGNALRVSNISDTHATITFKNCRYRSHSIPWPGLVIFQDSSSGKTMDFSKIKLVLNNLRSFDGTKQYLKNGTAKDDIIWYTYNTDTVPQVIFA